MRSAVAWVVSAVSFLVACGGASTHDGSGGSSNGGSSNGGTNTGGAPGACGVSPPADGSPCKAVAGPSFGVSVGDCSWGDDPRPDCRTRAVCQNDKWSVRTPPDSCQVDPKPAACPAAPAQATGACKDPTLKCNYDDGSVCVCSACKGGSEYPICQTIDPPQWACVKPADGCPNPAPQAGTPCNTPDANCGTSCELPIKCVGGQWQYESDLCPICAAPDTPIATPQGERAIAGLRVGDLVYSMDEGAIAVVPIAAVGSTPVWQHQVLSLELDDGRRLEISPGHPMADGRPLSVLSAGDAVDYQHALRKTQLVPYGHSRTYDILPASSSGTYLAAGVWLGSTLRRHRE